jgi:NCS1 family nucleobase:cation symporter-1
LVSSFALLSYLFIHLREQILIFLATGFFTSGILFYITMRLFPVQGLGEFDDVDYYGAFTKQEATKLGVMQLDPSDASLEGVERMEPLQPGEKGPKTEYIVADGIY